MAAIIRFEDIVAWQEVRKLTGNVYAMTARKPFAGDRGLRDQIQRASVSSMSNIAEGFDCESPIEFGRFLGIARRSAVEVQSLLYVALDAAYIDPRLSNATMNRPEKPKLSLAASRKASPATTPDP